VDGGHDVHLVPVKWISERLKLNKFSRHRNLLDFSQSTLLEVTDPEIRTLMRSKLPHSYNRFAKWKWILVIIFVLAEIAYVSQMVKH